MDDLIARLFHLPPSLIVSLTHDLMHAGVAILMLIVGWWLSNRIGTLT